MISSKTLLEKTGISRATLNNYIKRGLLPRPEIRTGAEDTDGSARLGYFQADVVDRIRKVQQRVKAGISMNEICEELGVENELPGALAVKPESHVKPKQQATVIPPALASAQASVSLDNYDSPAYMVNNQFELIWWNEAAVEELLPDCTSMPGELEARGALKPLLYGPLQTESEEKQELLVTCHLIAAHRRMTKEKLFELSNSAPARYRMKFDEIISQLQPAPNDPVLCFPLVAGMERGPAGYHQLYASYFREGILFTYGRTEQQEIIASILTQRPKLIASLLSQQKPHITPMAVLVADLQNSVSLCAELPAEEYFELINQIWQKAEPIFRKYHGTYGKHAGDGMLYYFLPQPDSDFKMNAIECALELQNMMQQLTRTWQGRKGWFNALHLNVGLHEGREWFGAFHAGSHVEFTVLGDTVNQASRLSDFARNGSIWATKSMINQIPTAERAVIHYGVYREGGHGERRLVSQSYSCISNLCKAEQPPHIKFREIEMLPITEILGLRSNDSLDAEKEGSDG